MNIEPFFEPNTHTLTYIVWDPETLDAVVIDPVLDFDPINLVFSETSIEALLVFVEKYQLRVKAVLETHIHADHITAAHRLRERLGALVVASSKVPVVQQTFKGLLELADQATNGEAFDVLLGHGDCIDAGSLHIRAIHTPGHTPACVTYQVGDAVFTGDALFMPDFGTGRCDFPEGSASSLYDSVMNQLYTLPDETRVFVGHDYLPSGRELAFQTTIRDCKSSNIQIQADTSREQFVTWRSQRDSLLELPRLIFHSVQLNINAGRNPPVNSKGVGFLKLPLQSL
jgi:glyoxylase-like metal-dependent hydrolase (beta-lactamase superfamily II)